MKKAVYLLGGNPLNLGFRDVADRMNCDLRVIDWNEHVPWIQEGEHIREDIKDPAVLTKVDLSRLQMAYSSADLAAYNVARINAAAGLKRPADEAIQNCTDKTRTYACFDRAGILNRPYLHLRAPDLAVEHRDRLVQRLSNYAASTRDIVVKPANNSSSRGVAILKNTDAAQLQATVLANYAEFKDEILVDQYIGGTEYSIEMLADDDGHIHVWPVGLKCKSAHGTSETVSVKVVYNPVLTEAFEQKMREFATACAKSTGIRNSLVHLEAKEWNGELYPIEIACRSSGFVASHLCDLASTHRYLESYARVLHGQGIDGPVRRGDRSSVYFFYDFPRGIVDADFSRDIDPFADSEMKTLYSNLPTFARGTAVGPHLNDDSKKLFRILVGPRSPELVPMIESMEEKFYASVLKDL